MILRVVRALVAKPDRAGDERMSAGLDVLSVDRRELVRS